LGGPFVALVLRPRSLPRAIVGDGEGGVSEKAISYLDLIATVDGSATVQQLQREPTRTLCLPQLPEGAVLAAVLERPSGNGYVVTGTSPPSTRLVTVEAEGQATTHEVRLPRLAWRAGWFENEGTLAELSIACVSGAHEGCLGPDTPLHAWILSNVYPRFGSVVEGVCWPDKTRLKMGLADVVEKGVYGFVGLPNNADRYSGDLRHDAPYGGYRTFVEAVEETGGVPDQWLVPLDMTLKDLHEQKGRKA